MKKDKHALFKWLSNGLLILGSAVGAVALINTWQLSKTLPAGVCPYTDTRSFMYVAIVLILAALVFSFFEGPGKTKK